MKKTLLLGLALILISTQALAVQNYMDRTLTTFVANGRDSIWWNYYSSSYVWASYNAFAHVDYAGIVGTYRNLAEFDTSAVESIYVKVKKVTTTMTYTPQGMDSDAANFRRLTSNWHTTSAAQTVYDAIASADNYGSQTSGVELDLGPAGVSQMEINLLYGQFNIGTMGVNETGDVENYITDHTTYVQYYYPPDEAEEWQIPSGDYPLGRTSGSGIGNVSSTQDITILNGGNLILYGNTNLTIPTGRKLTVNYGGKMTVATSEGAKFTKTW